jgi:hypothetical protein
MENKKAKKTRSRKPYPGKREEYSKEKTSKGCANDPQWYLVNGQLAKDVANFSFNNAVGDRVVRNALQGGGKQLKSNTIMMPGIASILVTPSIGVSVWENSPVNVAAKDIYSFVRHANSGHANYDPADLMIYLLAADSVQTFWSYMVRAYGVCQTFSQVNRYVGDAMLTAMGLDAADIRKNISQFRAYINQFAIKASVLAVPNTMTYFLRHSWLFQNIYLDEDNPKGQMYMYVPALLYQYALDSNSAGMLKTAPVAMSSSNPGGTLVTRVNTFAGIKTIGDKLLNAMLSQEDVGIMSGDILKAYGSDKLLRYAQIDENFAVSPIFSEEVLAQIHNTDFTGCIPLKEDGTDEAGIKWTVNYRGLDVTQDPSIGKGILLSTPAFANATRLAYEPLLDVWKWDVTPELALVSSRNKVMGQTNEGTVYMESGTKTSYVPVTIQTCGSEIPLDVVVYTYQPDGTLRADSTYTGGTESFNGVITMFSSKFNEFPLLSSVVQDTMGLPYGELSNYTVLSFDSVQNMHHTALLSMFGVPYRW